MQILGNKPPSSEEIGIFLNEISFHLPDGYMEFMKNYNGAEILFDETVLVLWPITDLISLNKEYCVSEFAPSFFLIGSDGGGEGYAINTIRGGIFRIPLIGMADDEAVFVSNSLAELLENL